MDLRTISKIVFILVFLSGCNNQKKSSGKFDGDIYAEPRVEASKPKENVQSFAYIKVLTHEPVGILKIPGSGGYLNSDYSWNKGVPGSETPSYSDFVHSSEIIELTDTSEDNQYRLMDEYISTLTLKSIYFKERKISSEVKDRKCLVFSSYKEASESKFNSSAEF